jgi:hypothetical protein
MENAAVLDLARARPSLVVLAAVVAMAAVRAASGQSLDPERIAAVQSGMVVNFLRYTTWPESAFKDGETKAAIVLTVVGESGLYDALVAATKGQAIGGRAIEVRRATHPSSRGDGPPRAEDLAAFHEKLKSSHAVFFGGSERERYKGVLEEIGKAAVLTISDIRGFAEAGGMLGLTIRERKVAFDANEEAIKAAALKVSSQVLRLARIVGGKDQAGGGR